MTLRCLYATEIRIDVFGAPPEPREWMTDVAALIGIPLVRADAFTFLCSAGYGWIHVVHRGALLRIGSGRMFQTEPDAYATIRESAPGLALEAQSSRTLTKDIGLAFAMHANVNSIRTVYGATLNLQFGRLGER